MTTPYYHSKKLQDKYRPCLFVNFQAVENIKIHYDRFYIKGPYEAGKPIRMFGFSSRPPCQL